MDRHEQLEGVTGYADAGVVTSHSSEIFTDNSQPVFPNKAGIEITELVVSERSFKIRLADTEAGRNSAGLLINKMYSWRGYSTATAVPQDTNRITLTASDKDSVAATLTLNLDSRMGLAADDIFKDEIDKYRMRGERICEFGKLAVDHEVQSKSVLAALFHIAFLYARRLFNCTRVFIEVNPRHHRYYQRMLGFESHNLIRTNRTVDAPACLLSLSLAYADEQIEIFGGHLSAAKTERSLYPYFFSAREAEGITGRLINIG